MEGNTFLPAVHVRYNYIGAEERYGLEVLVYFTITVFIGI